MRKFLIMLMVVAMASFLMVGCLSGVTPDVDEDVDEDVAVTGVTLDQATLALTVGDAPVTLVATVAPADATDPRVIWASSDEAVAIVALGVVTPLNAGISAITATTVDGPFVATCVVTVTAADVPAPASTTPVIEKIANVDDGVNDPGIINLYSSDTQYMNADEVADGILVIGAAPKYSEVNVYVDDEVVGTSTAYGVFEYFVVFIAEDDLGDDGEKTIYATATELGFAESANSTEYAFTLDTVAPEMVKVTAEVDEYLDGTVTATFDEELDKTTAKDEDNWVVYDTTDPYDLPDPVSSAELISPKVVELEVVFVLADPVSDTYEILAFHLIKVSCVTIKDLAGNETTDSGLCYLELEE